MQKHYDYIIAGAGAAGLSLGWKLMRSKLKDKKILIVDNDLSPKNDKTWCFWDSGAPPFSDIICKQWNNVAVNTTQGRFSQSLDEYTYYCLRSIDFKSKILSNLQSHPDFDLLEAEITDLSSSSEAATLHTGEKSYSTEYIFQSCFNPWSNKIDNPRYPLLQHFLGWEITLKKPLLDGNTFTLMDFDETFSDGIAFIYLLPWAQTSGLIEYTIFSDRIVSEAFYEEKLSLYLNNRFSLQPLDYQIQRREFGKIPMQDRPSMPWYRPRIMNLGSQGGLTKPSTGYTFKRIQDHTDAIIEELLSDGVPQSGPPSGLRYKAYDLWLLQILHDHPNDALRVFEHLFQNNSIDEIFRFLGEETSLGQDLKIMSSVPYLPFLRAIWKTRGRFREISKT